VCTQQKGNDEKEKPDSLTVFHGKCMNTEDIILQIKVWHVVQKKIIMQKKKKKKTMMKKKGAENEYDRLYVKKYFSLE
jgi:ribosomal protein L21